MSQLRIYRFPEWQETPYKFVDLKRHTDTITIDRAPPTEQEGRMSESLSRSRRTIQELILCNRFALFCTFTFDQLKVRDRNDYKAVKKTLTKAFNNFRTRYDPGFRYLIVPELHQNGAVHFHGVITTPYGLCSPLLIPKKGPTGKVKMVSNTPGYMDWPYYSKRFGFFSCSWIRDYTRCATYVSKYMTKELAEWFTKHDKIVLHSQGLERPELVHIGDNERIPGGIDEHRGDFDGKFCATAMRDVWETAPYYVNPDDNWEHYHDRAEQEGRVQRVSFNDGYTSSDPRDNFFPHEWKAYPGPYDEYDHTAMRASCLESALSKRR